MAIEDIRGLRTTDFLLELSHRPIFTLDLDSIAPYGIIQSLV